ncbi:MAG: chromate efflux transporter [Deltaproteobacteria bacterium]|nr:chromate efflux transporter [Deltaproteobacteria bacterium]
MPTICEIFREFLHLGTTAFGGLAMIEPIRSRVVLQKKWLSQGEFLDGLALCQMLPGATVVQLATYVGQRLQGVRGAVAAAGAFILPAFVLMLALSFLYFQYGNLPWVQAISKGLGAAVIALLVQTFWQLSKAIRRHWLDPAIAFLALLALGANVNYLLVFLAAALVRLFVGLKLDPLDKNPGEIAPGPRTLPGSILTQAFISLVCLATLVTMFFHLDRVLGQMSLIFLKIGSISFGGGYVMIPILQWEVVDRLQWLTLRQFLDGILLSYITPGPLLILAAFVGFWLKGLPGALVSTISVFLPPTLMIILLIPFYQRIKEAKWMRQVIQGILAALVGFLVLVLFQMGRAAIFDMKTLGIMLASATALIALKINLLWVIAAAAACSLLLF